MAVTLEGLYNWIVENWAGKVSFAKGADNPTTNPGVSFQLYLNTTDNTVFAWYNNTWNEGLGGGGGLDEVALQTALDDYRINNTFSPAGHSHTIGEIDDLGQTLSGINQSISDNSLALDNHKNAITAHTKSQVGLSNVDNTSDANKPISTATQTALNLKAPIESPSFTGTVSGITKGMVGLDDVDNTSDLNKPISTATQSALNAKLNSSLLDSSNGIPQLSGDKIQLKNIPDVILGQLIYAGTVDLSSLTASVSTNGQSVVATRTQDPFEYPCSIENSATPSASNTLGYLLTEGFFFIVSAVDNGGTTFAGKVFQVGDWLLSTGAGWEKIDNTDLVTSVNNQVGNVSVATPDKSINIAVPVVGEIPIEVRVATPFKITSIACKTQSGTCKFYLKKTGSQTKYIYFDSQDFIYADNLGSNYIQAGTSLLYSTMIDELNFSAGDGLSLFVTDAGDSKMLSVTIGCN